MTCTLNIYKLYVRYGSSLQKSLGNCSLGKKSASFLPTWGLHPVRMCPPLWWVLVGASAAFPGPPPFGPYLDQLPWGTWTISGCWRPGPGSTVGHPQRASSCCRVTETHEDDTFLVWRGLVLGESCGPIPVFQNSTNITYTLNIICICLSIHTCIYSCICVHIHLCVSMYRQKEVGNVCTYRYADVP